MSENTKIEWADHSWSPWRGCTKISPGCANCYAETLAKRNPAVLGQWGKGAPRVLAKNWNDPVKWQKRTAMDMPRPRVFPSLCDWLDEEVPVEWLGRFLHLIHETPSLDWLLLTKRPELFRKRLEALGNSELPWSSYGGSWISGTPPTNVWFGVSVEDQTRANKRIPLLLDIPAKLRWMSVEPLLGPISFDGWRLEWLAPFHETTPMLERTPRVDWVVVGGESGPNARPCNTEWIRNIVRECQAASVPAFVKQLGSVPFWNGTLGNVPTAAGQRLYLKAPKANDPEEWSSDLRVRKFPR